MGVVSDKSQPFSFVTALFKLIELRLQKLWITYDRAGHKETGLLAKL